MPAEVAQPKKYRKQTEQSIVKRAAHYMKVNYPNAIFFADASGVKMTDTTRMNMSAMRSYGLRVPDFCIDYPSRGYHGARFEFKTEGTVIYKKDGTLRKQPYVRRFKNGTVRRGDHLAEQAASLQKYNEAGYFARFVCGYDAFVKMVDWYFERPENLELF